MGMNWKSWYIWLVKFQKQEEAGLEAMPGEWLGGRKYAEKGFQPGRKVEQRQAQSRCGGAAGHLGPCLRQWKSPLGAGEKHLSGQTEWLFGKKLEHPEGWTGCNR